MILFTDETIVTRTPPLSACWARVGTQRKIPVDGSRQRRVVFGTTCIQSGALRLDTTERWNQQSFQEHLRGIRRTWRGWNIVLFLDRGSPHTARASRALAKELAIELRFLPTACPHLNPVELLWKHLKGRVWCNREHVSLDQDIAEAIRGLSTHTGSRIRQMTGMAGPGFWLAGHLSTTLW